MAHVFISYVSENREDAARLRKELRHHGVDAWIDREQILPGERWRVVISSAIQKGMFFIACFSREYEDRDQTYMNEELILAIEELRKRPINRTWFIPVRLSKCSIPARPIGGGETLRDIQWVDLFPDWGAGFQRILKVIKAENHSRRDVPQTLSGRNGTHVSLKDGDIERNLISQIRTFLLRVLKDEHRVIRGLFESLSIPIADNNNLSASWKIHINTASMRDLRRILTYIRSNFGNYTHINIINKFIDDIDKLAQL